MVQLTYITPRNVAEEDIRQVYDVDILGQIVKTTVAKHPVIAAQWMAPLLNGYIHRLISLELQLDNTWSRIGTVQLCDGERCLVIQIQRWTYLHPYIELLMNDHRNVFVGTQVRFKMRRLKREFKLNVDIETCSCRELPYRFTGSIIIRVADTMAGLLNYLGLTAAETDWFRPNSLSSQQVHYACARAFLSIHIYKYL